MQGCFLLDMTLRNGRFSISGRFTDPVSDRLIEVSDVPITEDQRLRVDHYLRENMHTPCVDRPAMENVYDETIDRLCVSWQLLNGERISEKYKGAGEQALLELLKSYCLQQKCSRKCKQKS